MSMSKNSLKCVDNAAIEASLEKEDSKIYAAKRLSKWFAIDLTISIFGVPIIEWHYPPLNERKNYEN